MFEVSLGRTSESKAVPLKAPFLPINFPLGKLRLSIRPLNGVKETAHQALEHSEKLQIQTFMCSKSLTPILGSDDASTLISFLPFIRLSLKQACQEQARSLILL